MITPAVARDIAVEAHAGAVDKAGRDYIDHPGRVVMRVLGEYMDDPDRDLLVALAWLHDVVEDTDVTLDDLAARGADARLLAAVDAISQRPGERRADYIARVAANPDSRRVKPHDTADNRDPDRLAMLDPADANRLRTKYANDDDLFARARADAT